MKQTSIIPFFSKIYKSFEEWWNKKLDKPITPYVLRITTYMKKHPKATLAEARGHRPKFYRFTWGIKGIPYEHESNCSAALFYWNFECDIDGESILLRQLEKRLRYGHDLWWFSYAFGFGRQEVPYNEKLVGKKEFEFKRHQ